MLTLDKHLTLDADAIKSPNLAEEFEEVDRRAIGEWVWQGYRSDKQSRAKWETRTDAAMDLAMQIQKSKSFPWPNASNIAFPLVTIATMQFHSRAYPTLVQAPNVVRYRVIGPDPGGAESARGTRVSTHMSWQRLEEDQPWEEGVDRALINVSVVGTAFKKSFQDASKGYPVSELVYARDLVLDYWAKSVEDCPRKTHVIPLSRNEVYERVKREVFCDVLEEGWYKSPSTPARTPLGVAHDNRQGVLLPAQVDETTPILTLEQHCNLDLDGDGYAEPYIITIEERNHTVLRIVTGFDREEDIERNSAKEIIRVRAMQYFTKIPFLPSPDGGIYDIGFGVLLGPLNESVNSIINQLVDAGTMQVTAGGFLGRGAKIRGGVYTFAPLEWKRVDSTGDDLRKNIVPLEVRAPSDVLFRLLAMLVEYTQRIPGTTEITVGENPGQNTPAETSRNMLNQGLKIYNALFKRIWRAMGEEFRKLYVLNGIYLPAKQAFGAKGQFVLREDYMGSPTAIVPEADPNITSDEQRMQQTALVAQRAQAVPGYDVEATERMLLKSWQVADIDQIYPGPSKVPQGKDPKIALEELKQQGKMMALNAQNAQFAAKLMEEHRLNTAKILELGAETAKLLEDAGDVRVQNQINALNTAVGAMKVHNDTILRQVELVMNSIGGTGADTGSTGMAGLVAASSNAGLAGMGAAGAAGAA